MCLSIRTIEWTQIFPPICGNIIGDKLQVAAVRYPFPPRSAQWRFENAHFIKLWSNITSKKVFATIINISCLKATKSLWKSPRRSKLTSRNTILTCQAEEKFPNFANCNEFQSCLNLKITQLTHARLIVLFVILIKICWLVWEWLICTFQKS